ncbi:hypothetical protein [Okeania sp. SIO2C2]|nr:hypothetical protein [Okeania sp. SIO2C2]
MGKSRRQLYWRQETGEMGIIEEVEGRIIKGLFCATISLKCALF